MTNERHSYVSQECHLFVGRSTLNDPQQTYDTRSLDEARKEIEGKRSVDRDSKKP